VAKEIPDVKLVIVGSGPEEEKIKEEISKLGIEKNVEIVGWVKKEEIDKFYEESSLVAVPSVWTETFGIVAVEAMSKGKPVIVSKFAGGLREIVNDGVNGYFADVKKTREFSSKIIKILSDDKKLEEFSKKSLELSKKYLNGRKHLKEIDKIYSSLRES
jgi:glycosyltransferase involved in cell wall biosynthesis